MIPARIRRAIAAAKVEHPTTAFGRPRETVWAAPAMITYALLHNNPHSLIFTSPMQRSQSSNSLSQFLYRGS